MGRAGRRCRRGPRRRRIAATLPANLQGPNVGGVYTLGRYLEDYDYLGDLGKTHGTGFDLDRYNGRFCVTPEFPGGTYAYFLSIESDGTPKFPYTLGRWFYGPTGGSVNGIAESVTEYVRGAPTAAATAVGGTAKLNVAATETGPFSYVWTKDGATVSGATSATFTVANLLSSDAGLYRATITNAGGTGIYAPGVQITGPVYVGELSGFDAAEAKLVFGTTTEVQINGGDLAQASGHAVEVLRITKLHFVDGGTSHGTLAAARKNRAKLEQGGVDVTAAIVVNP